MNFGLCTVPYEVLSVRISVPLDQNECVSLIRACTDASKAFRKIHVYALQGQCRGNKDSRNQGSIAPCAMSHPHTFTPSTHPSTQIQYELYHPPNSVPQVSLSSTAALNASWEGYRPLSPIAAATAPGGQGLLSSPHMNAPNSPASIAFRSPPWSAGAAAATTGSPPQQPTTHVYNKDEGVGVRGREED